MKGIPNAERQRLGALLDHETQETVMAMIPQFSETEIGAPVPAPAEVPEELGLLDHVAALPEPQRTAIHLHYYEGYSLQEIARLLGVTVPTVKMRLKRGRDALRNTWEEHL